MRYAVETRIFNNGKMVAKVREAMEGEEDSYRETGSCEIWVDVFETEKEAREFCKGYRSA